MITKPQLAEAAATFDETAHRYTAVDGEALSGVTPIVSWLLPDTYTGIPQAVLDRAAAHGHKVHEQCRMVDNLGILPEDIEPQTQYYVDLCRKNGLKPLANEYLIASLSLGVASSIDMVTEGLDLCDIKTTSSLHMECVTFQLSVYAMLFEAQNPGLKVGRLFALWVPKPQYGAPEARELTRIPAALCAEAVKAYVSGKDSEPYRKEIFPDYVPAAKAGGETLPVTLKDAEAEVIKLETELTRLKAQREKLTKGLLALMEEKGVKKWESDSLTLTYVPASTRTTFDSKRFKADHADTYAAYLHTTETAPSLRVSVRYK